MIRIFLFLVSINVLNTGVAQDSASTENTAPLVRGCYFSVHDYLTNSPSFVDSFHVTKKNRLQPNWENTYSRTPRFEGKNKKIKNIWGFCDGQDAYIFHQSEFFQIQKDVNGLFFIAYETYDFSSTTTAAIVGGAIGSAIASQMVIDNCKRERVRYEIQQTYGWAMHPNPSYNNVIPVENVVFYRLSKKEVEKPFQFMVNDSIYFSFEPNSFAEVNLPNETTEISFSFGEDFSIRKSFTLDLTEIDYFKLSISEKDGGELLIEQVSESEGVFYSESALKAQKKKTRRNQNSSFETID